MIALVTGQPGSGKSYYAVREIWQALEAGRYVATNVEMTSDWAAKMARGNAARRCIPGRVARIERSYRERLYMTHDLDELFRLRLPGTGEARGLCVLDEAHNWLNARSWRDDDRGPAVRWFTQHRKLGWDVLLITQTAETIDRQVRSLFEYHVHLRNLRRMKVLGLPVVPFTMFMAIWQWHGVQSKSIAKRQAYRLNKTIARTYDTLATSHGLEDDAAEAGLIYLGNGATLPAPSAPVPPARANALPAPLHGRAVAGTAARAAGRLRRPRTPDIAPPPRPRRFDDVTGQPL